MSELEDTLAFQLKAHKIVFIREYQAIPSRRFRWDFALPSRRLLIEVQGGGYVYGRHNRPAGQQSDCEKLNLAQLAGFTCLAFTADDVKSGRAIVTIEQALSRAQEARA